MAEETKGKANSTENKPQQAKKTVCWLKSRANHIIEVKEGVHSKFIPPFGKVKVVKEDLQFVSDTDTSYLTFVKA